MNRFMVTYSIVKEDGFLYDHKAKFASFQEAIQFIRMVTHKSYGGSKLHGKPIVERV